MAEIVRLGNAACLRRTEQAFRDAASAEARTPAVPTAATSPSDGSAGWQLPMPPVRFPLRDALLSFKETSAAQAGREAAADLDRLGARPPLKAKATEKSRALRQVGRMRRHGTGPGSGLIEEPPQPIPTAPPEADVPRTPPKCLPSPAGRAGQRRRLVERTAALWPAIKESHSAPQLRMLDSSASPGGPAAAAPQASGAPAVVPVTWTSAVRAVIAHGRRYDEGDLPAGEFVVPSWKGVSMVSYRNLPKPAYEWADRGFEFSGKGLGIGPRALDEQIRQMSRRSPGFVYEITNHRSIAQETLAKQPKR